MQPDKAYQQAIIIGGSLGGLLTARVLSNHFDHVTILERDPVSDHPQARKGQPQAQHLHALLVSGMEMMSHYFPDLPQALAENGAIIGDFAETMQWYSYGGYRKRFTMGTQGALMSRPLLEYLVRQQTLALPNVTQNDNCSVQRLVMDGNGQRVTGVQVEYRDGLHDPTTLAADLVIDCSGRGSRTGRWLPELGYEAAPESKVTINVGYTTRLYRRDPSEPHGEDWIFISPEAPKESRIGGLFPIEGDRWICTLSGWHGDHAPLDEESFFQFAHDLPAPDIYNIISQAEPLSDGIPIKFPHSLRRHYEKLRRFPEGYLVLGDAIASLNPVYGQGMSSAALQAAELDKVLTQQSTLDGLAPDFFKRAGKVVDAPWQLTVGEDFRYPQTTGPKPPGTDLINRYVVKVHRATLHDEVVGEAFLKVTNLMESPLTLFHPRILWRVLRHRAPRVVSKPVPNYPRPHLNA